MNLRTFLLLCLLLGALATGLSPLIAQDDPIIVTIPAGDSIKIGLATDLSNILPAAGLDMAQSADLAINQFNAEGGLMGFPIELMIEDDRCEAELGAQVATAFAEQGDIVAILGHLCSEPSMAAAPIYQSARIPMVSVATSGQLTARGWDVVNRTGVNDFIQGGVAARYLFYVMGVNRLGILHNRSDYGSGLAQVVEETFRSEGGTVVYYKGINPLEVDYAEVTGDISAKTPDALYFAGYSQDAIELVTALRENPDTAELPFFSVDGILNQDYIDFADEATESTYVTFAQQHGNAGANLAFETAYEAAYGIAPDALGPYHAQSYDAVQILLLALEQVAILSPTGDLEIDREALIDTIRATRRYRGLTGLLTCDAKGDCADGLITVFQVQDGEWVELAVPDEVQAQAQ